MREKLTVGELKEFLDGIPDNAEVRISSLYNTYTEQSYHVNTSDISYYHDSYDKFLILEPSEIDVSDTAGV